MFKNVKKKVVLVALVVLALGNAMSVSAASNVNSASYAGYVTKFTDYVTDPLYKTTLGDGTNKVEKIVLASSICSWINNYLGLRVTEKAYFESPGTYTMDFNPTPDINQSGIHLSTTMTISTQWHELDSTYVIGTWSPDPF